MNDRPLVSVVTPVLNGERYIRRTIESIINQSYSNIEYIIVDGVSHDATLRIVSEYQKHVNITISEPDAGMYDAINKGILKSSGQLLCYLNADDYFFPNTIELVVEKFCSTNALLLFGNCLYVDTDEHLLFKYAGANLPYFLSKRLGRIPFAQQTTFWSRDLYNTIGGFDQRYSYAADTKFLFECLRLANRRTTYIDNDLAVFRQHNEAFSTKLALKMAEEHKLVLSDLGFKASKIRYLIEVLVKINNYRNFLRKWL